MPHATARKSASLTHLRRRTVVGILRTWRDLTHSARVALRKDVDPSLPKEDAALITKHMRECLDAPGGEVSARLRTIELGKVYLSLNGKGRERFLRLLADEFDLDRQQLRQAIDAYRDAENPAAAVRAEQSIRAALVTPRSIILRQFNALPDGFKFLVDLRADLMPLIGKDAKLKGLEADLKQILSAWFDIGLLDLVEISWDSPAALLEKLMAYEAVHRITSWDDLKNRVDADRRVYAFLHNKMPMEPLIFVQVALVKGLAGSVQAILDQSQPVLDASEADTAIFYSISNAQKGLAGIPFGNFLIKRVVDKLMRELPHIKHFSTLSPIPGLRAWLDKKLEKEGDAVLQPAEAKTLKGLCKTEHAAAALTDLLNSDWRKDAKTEAALKPILLRLCADYLLHEKKGKYALDPVAHFHLTNGAQLERINWLGDTSAKGMKQAAGLMVNYYYALDHIDENHETYVTEGKVIASRSVQGLVK
jgi:malonyl-CoA decarboxylase